MISVLSAATRIACRQMTAEHLDAMHASVEQASGLPARPDWGRKATAHAELFDVLGDLTGDGDLALLVSSAAGRLRDLVLTVGPAADGIILSSRRRLLRQRAPARPTPSEPASLLQPPRKDGGGGGISNVLRLSSSSSEKISPVMSSAASSSLAPTSS